MEQIKHPRQSLSLKKILALYVLVFILVALFLSVATFSICNTTVEGIRASYHISGEKYYLTNEQRDRFGEGAYISDVQDPLYKQDEQAIITLETIPVLAAPIYFSLCIIAAMLLFYRNNLKKPFEELWVASEKIANNDLNIFIDYDREDELGQICTAFKMMRTTLEDNFSKMWRQVEERKELNAAFAHDLRTPLTVLKGYNDMLQDSDNPQTRRIAVTMSKNISRMERYVSSMSNLRRMEETLPVSKEIPLQSFISSLYENAKIVCEKNGKNLCLQNNVSVSKLALDSTFITQVCNHLISNAVRYARTTVMLSVSSDNNGFLLSVSDDGEGFHKNSLLRATDPYFTEESDSEHLGLGLYICRVLCKLHNGYLEIENTADGAKLSTYFKSPDS